MELKKSQKKKLEKMLNFSTSFGDIWKVLVFDITGRNIISPLFSVKDLRGCGVTLHLLIETKKDPIADVSSVYFVEPTFDNIDRIINDAKDCIYKDFHINFTSTASDDLITYFAKNSVKNGVENKIISIKDQFARFVCPETGLFTLCNDSTAPMGSSTTRQIADDLIGVLSTLKIVPVIKARRGSAAEKVAAVLAEKLSERQKTAGLIFGDRPFGFLKGRPLLLLVDRAEDVTALLHHTAAYQPLVHDLLALRGGRVEIEKRGEDGPSSEVMELDSEDEFWRCHRRKLFTDVAEFVNKLVSDYKAQKQKFSATPAEGANLLSAIKELPKIRAQKISADRHTAVATAVSRELSRRDLAEAFLAEENLILKKSFQWQTIEGLLRSEKMLLDDKTRLAIIFIVCVRGKGNAQKVGDVERILFAELESASNSILPKNTLKAAFSAAKKLYGNPSIQPALGSDAPVFAGAAEASPEATAKPRGQLFGSLLNQGARLFAEVKNLLPSTRLLPATKLFAAAANGERPPADRAPAEFAVFDAQKKREDAAMRRESFPEAVVFVVGAGNYAEMGNLELFAQGAFDEEDLDSLARGQKRALVYGCTHLASPNEFLEEMARFRLG